MTERWCVNAAASLVSVCDGQIPITSVMIFDMSLSISSVIYF